MNLKNKISVFIIFILTVGVLIFFYNPFAFGFHGDIDIQYYDKFNQKIKSRGNLIDGFEYGFWEYYDINGNITSSGEYNKNCRKNNIWKFYSNGKLIYTINYRNGVKLDSLPRSRSNPFEW